MKKNYLNTFFFTLPLLVFLQTTSLFAQRSSGRQYFLTLFGGGYHQVNVNADGLNYVINQFNLTRNLVGDQAMPNIEQPTGFSAFLGGYGYLGNTAILLELRYGNAGLNLRATDRAPGGNPVPRDLRFNMHNVQVAFGLMGVSSKYFGFGIGLAPDIGIHLINDRSGAGQAEIINNFTFGTSFILPVHLLLGPVMIGVRPYYTLQFGTNDYTELNVELNPNTYQTNPPQEQMSNLNHFGIEFRVGILIGKRERR